MSYRAASQRRKYHTKKWRLRRDVLALSYIIFLMLSVGPVLVAGLNTQIAEASHNQIMAENYKMLQPQLAELADVKQENAELKPRIEALEVIQNKPRLSETEFVRAVKAIFPAHTQERAIKISHCENGTHVSDGVGVNTGGWSRDRGIFQINDYYHSNRVVRMFGETFEKAMNNPVKNMLYARFLTSNSGNWSLWSCDKKV